MDSNIVSGIIGLAGALIGAYIGGRATRRAADQSFNKQVDLQQAEQERMVEGVLQALYEELSAIWEVYMREVGQKLEQLEENQIFGYIVPLTQQDYFTIFNNNSAFIGHIRDPELRQLIVKTYMRAKGVLDSVRMHNQLSEDYEQVLRLDQNAPFAHGNLLTYTNQLKENHYDTKMLVEETLRKLTTRLRSLNLLRSDLSILE
jgi:hypothetical protein